MDQPFFVKTMHITRYKTVTCIRAHHAVPLRHSIRSLSFYLQVHYAFIAAARTSGETWSSYFLKFAANMPASSFAVFS
jgi:hypothetical protein